LSPSLGDVRRRGSHFVSGGGQKVAVVSRHTRACPLVPPTLSSRRWRQRSRRWWRRWRRRWWRRRHTAFLCSLSSRSSDGAASSGARPFPGLPPFASLRRSPRPPPSGPTFPFATLDAPRRPTTSLATARPSSETSAPLHRRFPPPRRPPAPAAPPAAPPASSVSLPPATDASLLLHRDRSFLVARRASSSFSVDSHGPASVSTILSLRFTRDLSAFINSTGGERCIVVVVVEMLQRPDNRRRSHGYGRFLDSEESRRARGLTPSRTLVNQRGWLIVSCRQIEKHSVLSRSISNTTPTRRHPFLPVL
jgi:hypothetical protein